MESGETEAPECFMEEGEGQVCSLQTDRLGTASAEFILFLFSFFHGTNMKGAVSAPGYGYTMMYRKPLAACREKERRSWDQEGRENNERAGLGCSGGEQKGGPCAGGGELGEPGGVAPICPAAGRACRSLSQPLSWAIGPAP